MFQRILLAWDGSRAARRALDIAIDLARRYEAEVVAASVAHSPAHAETEGDRRESVEAARRYLVQSLNGVRDRADRVGVPLEQVVIEGDHPAEDVLAYAHEHGFDLVVAGITGGARPGASSSMAWPSSLSPKAPSPCSSSRSPMLASPQHPETRS
jgi:nucleotide-binding universal stress UspA family protein